MRDRKEEQVIFNLTSKPKQVLFFFLRKSFAGIPREFRGKVLLFCCFAFRVAYSLYFCYDISSFAKQ